MGTARLYKLAELKYWRKVAIHASGMMQTIRFLFFLNNLTFVFLPVFDSFYYLFCLVVKWQ